MQITDENNNEGKHERIYIFGPDIISFWLSKLNVSLCP